MEQIFIEDYVITFLKKIKTEANQPIRLSLFGHTEKIGDDKHIFVYGAACKEEGRTAEETGREYFAGHSFLGFVHVNNSENKGPSKYSIFFEANEAMQDYMLFYTKGIAADRKPSSGKQITAAEYEKNGVEILVDKTKKPGIHQAILNKIKMLLLGLFCFILAIIIGTINDYGKMYGLTQATREVMVFIEETG